MPRRNETNPNKRPVEQYDHKDKKRLNNPPVGLVDASTDAVEGRKTYAYDPHLDPQLTWAGKAERTSFETSTVSLHVHERIDPRGIIEAVRKKNGANYEQLSLFAARGENPPLREAIDFYKHAHNWSNRLIAGDSLLVMNSLIEKEGMAGQVQMIYIDPPYGIKYGSNFQPFVNKRDVKDGKDEDLTQEPEMIKAFRDTWELGIHSYLTYLRDRLLLARELLHESGSCFVQISDDNVHHVREMLDEMFGERNFLGGIAFVKTSGLSADQGITSAFDYLLWYARDSAKVKQRGLFVERLLNESMSSQYSWVELRDGTRRKLFRDELTGTTALPNGAKRYRIDNLTKPGPGARYSFTFKGTNYDPGRRWWGTTHDGMDRVAAAGRVQAGGSTIYYVRFWNDFPFRPLTNLWVDTAAGGFAEDRLYVVQTGLKVIERCILMTTDPGDLVFDPTCGSGTTAYVAEQWGRRWITCDTSRVAAHARQAAVDDGSLRLLPACPRAGRRRQRLRVQDRPARHPQEHRQQRAADSGDPLRPAADRQLQGPRRRPIHCRGRPCADGEIAGRTRQR